MEASTAPTTPDGSLSFSPVLQPTQLLTKQTIGSTTNWTAPTDARAQFLKLWHLG